MMKRTQSIDITTDIDRGFVISKGRDEVDRFNAYWNYCKQNDRISIEVRIKGRRAVCKIDTFPVNCVNHPYRFSDVQLEQLETLAVKHRVRGKTSSVADIFSTLNFATEDALAFAADVAEWLKTVEIEG
jgi:hypothetical protein